MNNNSDFLDKFNIVALRHEAMARCDDVAVSLLGRPAFTDAKEMRWGRHGSLALDLGKRRGLWYDHENGDGGDVFDLVSRERGGGFVEACLWLTGILSMTPPDMRTMQHFADDLGERIEKARSCYSRGRQAGQTGRRYFEDRGLDWHPDVERQMRYDDVWFKGFDALQPALLMPFRDIISHQITGVHKIALDCFSGGRRVKRSAGRISGSVMIIGSSAANPDTVCVCEGLETGVGAVQSGVTEGHPVWALSGASFLSTFMPVPGIERLIILADNDAAGRGAANRCAALWDQDAFVDIVWPKLRGSDFADQFRRQP